MRALNGAAGGGQNSNVDPMAKVLSVGGEVFDEHGFPRRVILVAIAMAIMLHGGVAGAATSIALFAEIVTWNKSLQETVAAMLLQTYEVQMEKEKPPPPPPEPPPEKEVAPPPPPKDAPPPPPPPPAEAAKVLTQEP